MEGKEKEDRMTMAQTGCEYLRPLDLSNYPASLSGPSYLFMCTASFRQMIFKEPILLHACPLVFSRNNTSNAVSVERK